VAYVRKCTTKAGSQSTTLVEAYRDKSARARQRILPTLRQPILACPGERAINQYEGEPEGLSIRLAFVGRFLLLADDAAP
jgi:hypothetical protein